MSAPAPAPTRVYRVLFDADSGVWMVVTPEGRRVGYGADTGAKGAAQKAGARMAREEYRLRGNPARLVIHTRKGRVERETDYPIRRKGR